MGALYFALPSCTQSAPPNLLLVVIDTIRRDRMSLYEFPQPTTPRLEQLAAEGVTFEQAITHVPQTLPSVASLLTSLRPFEHGLRVNGRSALGENALTLAEVLEKAGYATGAIVSAFPLSSRFAIDQGFRFFDADFRDSALAPAKSGALASDDAELAAVPRFQPPAVEQRAEEATDKAIAWLHRYGGRGPAAPFFLLVHYFDPHHPYRAPSRYGVRFEAYDAEIAYTDAEVGRLLAELRKRGLLDRTLVVVTGDHGELLDPTDPTARHAGHVEEAVLRVPLVMRLPEAIPPGARVTSPVGLVDVAPTILELLGIPSPAAFGGRSLVPLIRGEVEKIHDEVYFETLYWKLEAPRGLSRFGVWTSHHRYVLNRFEEGERIWHTEELYALGENSGGERNLLEDPVQTSALLDVVAALRERTQGMLAAEGPAEPLDLTAEDESALRSLGYLGGPEAEEGSGSSGIR